MSDPSLIWNSLSPLEWAGLLGNARKPALQQAWEYGEAILAQGHAVHRAALMQDGHILGMAQIAERQILGPLRIALLMRGPVWLETGCEQLEARLIELIRQHLRGAVLIWTPEVPESPSSLKGLCGYRRVLTGYSTIQLDLAKPLKTIEADLHGKWRNMLQAARRQDLVIKEVKGGFLQEWLIAQNEAYRKKVGYAGPSPDFIRSLSRAAPPKARDVWIAVHGKEPVAGIIVHKHGRSATYYAGVTTPRGRELRAHHALLWQAVESLQQAGIACFDLGGIDTEKAPGVARFKLGLGGTPITLAGSYLVPPLFAAGKKIAHMQEGPQQAAALPKALDKPDKAA